jgi:hypothetical protein
MARGLRFSAAAAIAALALACAACGGAVSATKTVTVTTTAATPTASSTSAGETATTAAVAAPRRTKKHHHAARTGPSGRTACDAQITVKTSTTSCAFGENVFYGYWNAQDQGDDAFAAYSPVSKQSYPMTCVTGTTVVCRAGDGGEVRFAQAAIDAYDSTQATHYAETHDTGPTDAASDPSSDGSTAASAADSDCDPNYEGACLDPSASDYDCEGGSGNGPEYTGTVTVVGEDHFGLDADGNGVGCE